MAVADTSWRDRVVAAQRRLRQQGRHIHVPLGHGTNQPPMTGMNFMARLAYEQWITDRWKAAGSPSLGDDDYFNPYDGVVVHPA